MLNQLSRLRKTDLVRNLVRETELESRQLILPLFVRGGKNVRREISSMPGQYQLSIDQLLKEASRAQKLGLAGVILFGIPERKDEQGSGAYDDNGIVQTAIRAIKDKFPKLLVIADTCFCEYTSHGHCGVMRKSKNGYSLDHAATLELLARAAVSQADAGADWIAPSGMIDGMVKSIRSALDGAGHQDKIILSYAAKYASAFYGPFREAAQGAPQFGDRKSYQMDPGNRREAMREVAQDLNEGADLVMVKPALSYLDIIRQVKDRFDVPVAAYNVSGEYAMAKAAAQKGWLDEKKIVLEILTSIKRAGADLILTYHAAQAAELLNRGRI